MNRELFTKVFSRYHGYDNLILSVFMGRRSNNQVVLYSDLAEFRENGLLTHGTFSHRDNISSFVHIDLTEMGINLLLYNEL